MADETRKVRVEERLKIKIGTYYKSILLISRDLLVVSIAIK